MYKINTFNMWFNGIIMGCGRLDKYALLFLIDIYNLTFYDLYMRTSLNLPPKLVLEAQTLLGYTSKTDTVIFSLQELVRKKRIEELKKMAGHVPLNIDLNKSRRRVKNL